MRSIPFLFLLAVSASAADADRDGLNDALEQKLLEQFLPRFYLSGAECDGGPAEFAQGVAEPMVKSRGGVLYGQAFPVEVGGGRWVELHFHHLWSRDCGRNGHPLDAEHVSALVSEVGGHWRAGYWYAAAHEGTVCDVSMARRAGVEARAEVWISAGKHASFLSAEACNKGGCGGDRCTEPRKIAEPRMVNLGQRGSPMPGAEWAASAQWPLAAKLDSDFSEPLLARLNATGETMRVAESLRGTQTTLAVGSKPVSALDASANGTKNFLGLAARGVSRFLKRW